MFPKEKKVYSFKEVKKDPKVNLLLNEITRGKEGGNDYIKYIDAMLYTHNKISYLLNTSYDAVFYYLLLISQCFIEYPCQMNMHQQKNAALIKYVKK